MAGIQGNTVNQQQRATTTRTADKSASIKVGINIGIVIALITISVILVKSGIGFFWGLVSVAALFAAANAASKMPIISSYWQTGFRSFGWIAFASILLGSGIGMWVKDVVDGVDTAAFCAVKENENNIRCKAKKDREEEEKIEATVEAAAMSERQRLAARQSVVAIPAPIPFTEKPCAGEYEGFEDCRQVVFGDTPYYRAAKTGKCLVYNPQELVNRTDIGASQYEFRGRKGATVNFFDLNVGEKHGSFVCGG